MQAIVTKYIGPSDTKGARIKATCAAGSITVSWDHALGEVENHTAAAKALVEAREWDGRGEWHFGGMPNETGYVFVCALDSLAF